MKKLFNRRRGKGASVVIGLITILVGMRFWYLEEQGNFHPITPEEAYRSAQLDQDELEYYISKFGIRSIINLRGKNPRESWYKEEVAICRELGVKHYDLKLSPDKTPSLQDIKALLQLFDKVPWPVLIHCKAGADRSGLAAALWLMAVDGAPKSIAKRQLSLRYGHLPFGPTQKLDCFFNKWASIQKKNLNRKR